MACELWDPFKLSNVLYCPKRMEEIVAFEILNVFTTLMLLGFIGLVLRNFLKCCSVAKDCIEDVENGTRNRSQESQQTSAQNLVSSLSQTPNISTKEGDALTLPPSYDEAVKPKV